MARYITDAEFKAYVRDETVTANLPFCQAALEAAQAELDNACQRRFEVAGATPTSRVFGPQSQE